MIKGILSTRILQICIGENCKLEVRSGGILLKFRGFIGRRGGIRPYFQIFVTFSFHMTQTFLIN